MSGHSKWSTIKHRKAAQDAKKGKVFTKLIKEITIAARLGGGDIEANPRLRTAVAAAKGQSMPKDNIDRAIKKGTGELDGENYEEIIYEGYGPHNVALIVEALTDNRNRTISTVRHAFNKTGGNLGSSNSVQYMFDRKGVIIIPLDSIDEDTLTEKALEAGAEDLVVEEGNDYEIHTNPSDLEDVRSALEDAGITIDSANVGWVPQNKVDIEDPGKAAQVMKLIDILEDDDDVQNVFSNVNFTDAAMEGME